MSLHSPELLRAQTCLPARDRESSKIPGQGATHVGVVCSVLMSHDHTIPVAHTELVSYLPRSIKGSVAIIFLCPGTGEKIKSWKLYQ